MSGVFDLARSLTSHPSLKRPIPKITIPTRKPTAVAMVCASYLSPSGPLCTLLMIVATSKEAEMTGPMETSFDVEKIE